MAEHRKSRVYTIMMVPATGQFVILLEDVEGTRLLPIWIGRSEGESILIKIQDYVLPRPITHDLMINILAEFNSTLKKVVITDLKKNTYYAELIIEHEGKTMRVDSRPSDAIALALRAEAGIYINKQVFDKCPVLFKPISEKETEDFKNKLSCLSPSDFFNDLNDLNEDI